MNPQELSPTATEKDKSSRVPEKQKSSNKSDVEEKESEEAYRLRVYGTYEEDIRPRRPRRPTTFRRLSQSFSDELLRRRSSFAESLPDTPQGWVVLLSLLSSAVLGYEIQLQKSLTAPPIIFGQCDEGPLKDIYNEMTKDKDASILLRPIHPSLFVGTRGLVSSVAAYVFGGPAATDKHIRFREILTMTQDGAKIALDWELPPLSSSTTTNEQEQRKQEIIHGPIQQPVVLILHGINNNADFGYVRSLMRACTDQGWVAAGMNFRGCGGVPLATPRAYNGAYTGDIRCTVDMLAARLAQGTPLFLVGNSLGANLLAKYLGEEGLSGSLPECVAAGVTLGNPMWMNTGKIDLLYSPIMALGVKKTIVENWASLRYMNNPEFRSAIRKALLAPTLADFDNALANVFIRNEPVHPFSFHVGYEDGKAYWDDASSFRYISHVSVPMLQLVAVDDFLVYGPFRGRLQYCLANPNIMVVETRCGGHLGWHESPPDGSMFQGTSWADVATIDFIAAVLETRAKRRSKTENGADIDADHLQQEETSMETLKIRSRL